MDKLEKIFEEQRALNNKTFHKQHEAKQPFMHHFGGSELGPGYSFSQVCELEWTDPLRQYWIGKFMQAITAEVGELHETTAWKWWRPLEAMLTGDSRQNARVEAIDILHFLISLFMLMGIDAQGVLEIYQGKNKVNHDRQDSGYVEKTADDTHIHPTTLKGTRLKAADIPPDGRYPTTLGSGEPMTGSGL